MIYPKMKYFKATKLSRSTVNKIRQNDSCADAPLNTKSNINFKDKSNHRKKFKKIERYHIQQKFRLFGSDESSQNRIHPISFHSKPYKKIEMKLFNVSTSNFKNGKMILSNKTQKVENRYEEELKLSKRAIVDVNFHLNATRKLLSTSSQKPLLQSFLKKKSTPEGKSLFNQYSSKEQKIISKSRISLHRSKFYV